MHYGPTQLSLGITQKDVLLLHQELHDRNAMSLHSRCDDPGRISEPRIDGGEQHLWRRPSRRVTPQLRCHSGDELWTEVLASCTGTATTQLLGASTVKQLNVRVKKLGCRPPAIFSMPAYAATACKASLSGITLAILEATPRVEVNKA
jgi:hypothetical protein